VSQVALSVTGKKNPELYLLVFSYVVREEILKNHKLNKIKNK
jgi:hypothetical protein